MPKTCVGCSYLSKAGKRDVCWKVWDKGGRVKAVRVELGCGQFMKGK